MVVIYIVFSPTELFQEMVVNGYAFKTDNRKIYKIKEKLKQCYLNIKQIYQLYQLYI